MMNFIRQIKAFWELSPLPSLSACAVYMAIFLEFNRSAKGAEWPDEIRLSDQAIGERSGLAKNTVRSAVAELEKREVLIVERGTGNGRPSLYRLVALYDENRGQNLIPTDKTKGSKFDTYRGQNLIPIQKPTNKKKNKRLNDDELSKQVKEILKNKRR